MLKVRIEGDRVRIGRHFTLSFERTLRIPDDRKTYPLPPSLGSFPVRRVRDYAKRVPESWREHGGVFIPMYQREAMWLLFRAPHWRPCAVQVGVGKVNAISGKPWDGKLARGDQDYVVCPDQPWLDGIKAGEGFIKQFVAMPLGMGYTVEGQVTGKEEFGGLQVQVFDPKPGQFPEMAPREPRWGGPRVLFDSVQCCSASVPEGAEMGLGAGGRMHQEIYPDAYGIDTWDETNSGRVFVHIVNSMMYREITGEEPPATPVSARLYTEHGLPWFGLYDEGKGDVKASVVPAGVKSVKEMDEAKGFGTQLDDEAVEVGAGQVIVLGAGEDGNEVADEKW
jgi:hypothetical protein